MNLLLSASNLPESASITLMHHKLVSIVIDSYEESNINQMLISMLALLCTLHLDDTFNYNSALHLEKGRKLVKEAINQLVLTSSTYVVITLGFTKEK